MKWWPFERKQNMSLDDLIAALDTASRTSSGEDVNPENCMRSPTIHAIVTAVSRRLSVSPVRVLQTTEVNGRRNQEWLPRHPVQRLLDAPNDVQSDTEYWQDATSSLLRWGRFHAAKVRASTGPIQRLRPLPAGGVSLDEDAARNGQVVWNVTVMGRELPPFRQQDMHTVRLTSRNYLVGDSPIADIRETVALEIAAEQFGATFFGNGALPLMLFQPLKRFESEDAEKLFIKTFQDMFGGKRRHTGMILPSNVDVKDPIQVDNERSQFLETRQYQRTVIAGAYGVPPHLVGDLTSGTFNNVEQQSREFVINVVLPFARLFESAMERDLLTPTDRNNGRIIRFNLDEVQRADFRTRQEGLWRQRQAGVINANDWREREGMNPIEDDEAGETYWQPVNMADAAETEMDTDVLDGGGEDNVASIR